MQKLKSNTSNDSHYDLWKSFVLHLKIGECVGFESFNCDSEKLLL